MKTTVRVIHWLPRIICILAILLISSLATDAFQPGLTIWQQLGGFFIHLIPSFVLLTILIIAWKWELIGGIILILISLTLSPFIYSHNYNMNHSVGMSMVSILIVNFPFMVAGILFLLSHVLKKRNLHVT